VKEEIIKLVIFYQHKVEINKCNNSLKLYTFGKKIKKLMLIKKTTVENN